MSNQIFKNLTVIDPSSESNGAHAILVKDGLIAAIGSYEELITQATSENLSVEEIDLDGNFLLPGFVDPHAHPLMYGQMMDWVDVGPKEASSIEEIIQILQVAESKLAPGFPLRAFGYEHRNLKEGRHPTRHDVDKISTSRPIYIMNASGHGGAVNSLVLESNAITAETSDPKGGRFERDENGIPTGVIWDAACDILTGPDGVKIANHGPNFHLPDSLDRLVQEFLQAEADFVKNGTTTIGDAQVSMREYEVYEAAKKKNLTRCRYSFFLTSALLPHANQLRQQSFLDQKFMEANGIKLYADGTLGGWTAYFPEGYAADKNRTGQLYHSVEEYEELFLRAGELGFHIATHAQSPTAIAMVIQATRKLREKSYKTPNGEDLVVRIEHCGLPMTEQSQEMAELGIMSVSQPLHHHNWGDGVVTAVGAKMGGRFNPLGEFIREGVSFALSSDAPVAKPRPFQAIAASVDRRTVHGTHMGDHDLSISISDALIAHTMGGAHALGKASLIGSISKNKCADFAVVAKNPLTLDVAQLRELPVESTWVAGKRVF